MSPALPWPSEPAFPGFPACKIWLQILQPEHGKVGQQGLRLVRCHWNVPGFRTRQVLLVTTLLDAQLYPAREFSALYLRRWEMELSFRHLKITLQMDQLSCKTPENLAREIRFHLLVYNCTRRVMLQAARQHRVPLNRLSFCGRLGRLPPVWPSPPPS